MRLALLVLLAATAVMSDNRQDEINKLIELVQFGKGPAQILTDHIDSLVLSYRTEQLDHETVNQVQSTECASEIGFRTKETNDAAEFARKSSERKQRCNTAWTLAQSDLKTFTRYQTIFSEDQSNSATKRQQDAASTKKVLDNFNYVLQVLATADEMVNDWVNSGASFLQVTAQMNQLMLHASKIGYIKDLAPIFTLLQVNQAPSEDLAERLHTLFQTIRDKLLAGIASTTEQENSAIEDFNHRKERNTLILEELAALIEHLKQYIKENETCIKRETDLINAATQKKNRNQVVLDSAKDLCSAFQDNISVNSQQRNTMIDTLMKLRKFVLAKNDEFGRIYGEDVEEVFTIRQSQVSFAQLSANLRMKL